MMRPWKGASNNGCIEQLWLHDCLRCRGHSTPPSRLVVVFDSENVFKGALEWSEKWRRHHWHIASGEVGHRDLWEQIVWYQERAGAEVGI